MVEKAGRRTAWDFLEHLLEMVPYRIHNPTRNDDKVWRFSFLLLICEGFFRS